MAKTWTDQPDVVQDLPVVSSISLHTGSMEVRKDVQANIYYATAGNLFGSQTLRIVPGPHSYDTLLQLVATASRRKSKPVDLPVGVEIVS